MLPRNDPFREASNEYIGADAAFCLAVAVSELTCWESAVGYIFSRKKKTGQVWRVGWSRKRESGLQVPGSFLGRGGAASGAGRVGFLLTADKLRFFHW